MANLFKTMEGAAQRLPAVTRPVSPRSPPIATAPAVSNELDLAERLERLDAGQLRQVAQALRGSWTLPVGDDEGELRQALLDYVEEWADDAAEEADGDPEGARAVGRQEAAGFIEEEMFRVIAPATPQHQWRQMMGVSEARLEELIDEVVIEPGNADDAADA